MNQGLVVALRWRSREHALKYYPNFYTISVPILMNITGHGSAYLVGMKSDPIIGYAGYTVYPLQSTCVYRQRLPC